MSDDTAPAVEFFQLETYTAFIDYSVLLSNRFNNNSLWVDLANAYSIQDNCLIQYPLYALSNLREPDIMEDEIKAKNIRMMGLNLSSLGFSNTGLTSDEYDRLVRNLGTYYQTRGASSVFINFLSFIKNVTFQYIPLWAQSLNDTINALTDLPGQILWQNGSYFPTTYYDVGYNAAEFTVDETEVIQLIQLLAPIHIVLRQLVGITRNTVTVQITAACMLVSHDSSIASR